MSETMTLSTVALFSVLGLTVARTLPCMARVLAITRSISFVLLFPATHLLGLWSCASPSPATTVAETGANGACGVRCAGANGESACINGACRMVRCIPGHCDLDGDPKNGCEARTKGCRVNKE
jgi:hypothetical protein